MSDSFKPSVFQAAFFDWILFDQGSCVLEAVAGSGKTTTLIEALRLMKGSIFFGAYNKKIATEIEQRAPKRMGLRISTLHAAGFQAWRDFAGSVKVESNKDRDIFRQSKAYATHGMFEGPILELVSYAKQAGIGITTHIDDIEAWKKLVDHFNVECLDAEREVILLARKVLQRSSDLCTKIIDFNDMIWAPLAFNVKFNQFDWVLIDEAQDTNATRRELALRMLKPEGRLVAVGDRHQAIYGFTGADADALDLIGNSTNAKRLSLPVTYRCPMAVVKYAQQFVNHIQSHPDAALGEVVQLTNERLTKVVAPGDAILCRLNQPLIRACYQFIAEGIPAKVEGREIGEGLKKLASRWAVKSFTTLETKLEDYRVRETEKLRAKEQESKATIIEDTVECVKILIKRCLAKDLSQANPVKRIIAEIETIFGDDIGAEFVVLASGHKSKGREWNNVLWLQTGPSKWAKQTWELEQENNICYVIATRAKQKLMLITAP